MRAALILVLCGVPAIAQGQTPDAIAQLRQEIRTQQGALEEQSQALARLVERLEALERASGQPVAAAGQAPPPAPGQPATPAVRRTDRDPVGDLNAERVEAGDFEGSILLPGRRVSLGITGMIKTQGFYDTNAEGREAVFLPAFLGAGRDDQDGTSSLSAELSRVAFDGRTKVGDSNLRGYIEYDFSGGGDQFKLRHAYFTWDKAETGQLLVGKTWSNLMDLLALPEGVTEPTFSGGIFTRQAQFRYTRSLGESVKWSTSLEDPASSDITAAAPVNTRTAWPDLTTAFTLSGKGAHVRMGGLLRRITVDPDGQEDYGATGWGIHTSGHVNVGQRDKLIATVAYGEGVGRYMLGLLPGDAALVDVEARTIEARENFGVVGGVRHQWSKSCRSSFGVGYASAETTDAMPDSALRASLFGLANVLCSASRFVTVGLEYNYGRRYNKVGSIDNNRFVLGMQIF